MKNAINLIERAQELKAHLEATVAANPQLPAKPREIISDAIAHAASLAEKLRTIPTTMWT
jgi:hypothetical protein